MVMYFKLNISNVEKNVMIKLRETKDINFIDNKQKLPHAYKNITKRTIFVNK